MSDLSDVELFDLKKIQYACKACAKLFSTKAILKRHSLMAHEPDSVSRIPCSTCDKTFKNKYNYEQHLLLHSSERKYPCTLCSKSFAQASSLTVHMKVHGNVKSVCTVCGGLFTKLDEHMRTHSGELPYKCDVCDEAFRTSAQRRYHCMRHMSNKNFQCDVCKTDFSYLSSLYKHKKAKHGSALKCAQCDKAFIKNENLQLHMQNKHPQAFVV